MNKELAELMEEERKEGIEEGRLEIIVDLMRQGMLEESVAASQLNMDISELRAKMNDMI